MRLFLPFDQRFSRAGPGSILRLSLTNTERVVYTDVYECQIGRLAQGSPEHCAPVHPLAYMARQAWLKFMP
jgi:hypothetical protein